MTDDKRGLGYDLSEAAREFLAGLGVNAASGRRQRRARGRTQKGEQDTVRMRRLRTELTSVFLEGNEKSRAGMRRFFAQHSPKELASKARVEALLAACVADLKSKGPNRKQESTRVYSWLADLPEDDFYLLALLATELGPQDEFWSVPDLGLLVLQKASAPQPGR
jgi:hypothetical protein